MWSRKSVSRYLLYHIVDLFLVNIVVFKLKQFNYIYYYLFALTLYKNYGSQDMK